MSVTLFIFIAFQTVLIASSSNKCATLYNVHSYQGQQLTLQDRSTYNSLRYMNYVPNSLTVAPDCFLTAYDSYGRKHNFNQNLPNLSWNQAQTLDATCCECKGCFGASENLPICARLYENERCDGCSGFRLDFRSGDSAKDLGPVNNRMSSVAVRRGCTLTVYFDTHFQGWRHNFTEANNKLGANWFKQISSAECGCNDAGPVVDPIYGTTHAPVTSPTIPTWPPIYTVPTTPYTPRPIYTLPTEPTRPPFTYPTVPTWAPIYTLPTTRPVNTLPTVPTTTKPPMTLPTVPPTTRPPTTLPTVPTTTSPPMTLPTVPLTTPKTTTTTEDDWDYDRNYEVDKPNEKFEEWPSEESIEVVYEPAPTEAPITTTTPKPVTTTTEEPEEDESKSEEFDDYFGGESTEIVSESTPLTTPMTTNTPKPVTTTTTSEELEVGKWDFVNNEDAGFGGRSSESTSPTTTTEQPEEAEEDDWLDW